ncbi:YigZ family protein [Candidatus Epulonipiscium fishelsonii]|uniref:YigZ family protein n=1 Tax=Candidatus Epulonipiscium fishelsonii TaxID=77094 RepID=A0ACC8X7Y2_9FIRM|nr:YigZ family protein [Epulopiscium sp. SCG-B11WGA-EpuloA1]ONI40705.1 YigZ family protein [Epulopiscium sp. SCG-B05WGA-EpuloA1]
MQTINSISYVEIVEKKSTFIGQAFPINSKEEADEHISSIKKKYKDATHNCYAYKVSNIEKCSDDGEPSGTAGKPILDVLKNVDNVLIIVTRYFGGTLLGTGGLVRAYGSCAKLALNEAGIVAKKEAQIFQLVCEYNFLGKAEHLLKPKYTVQEINYLDKVYIQVVVLSDQVHEFKQLIQENMYGNVELNYLKNIVVFM